MPAVQCRAWTGTAYSDLVLPEELLTYSVWQEEMCPTSGRAHRQFFLLFKKKISMKGVKDIIGPHHLEAARDLKACREYCMKTETRISGPFEFGTFGKLSVIKDSVDVLALCKRLKVNEVLEENPHLWRAVRQLKEVRSIVSVPRDFATSAILLTGPTGSGKTRLAVEIATLYSSTFWAAPDLKWFDGYDGDELMVIDEYRGQTPVSFLLRLIDRTPLTLPLKGSSTQMRSELVIFTSNLSLKNIFPEIDPETFRALERRITQINIL